MFVQVLLPAHGPLPAYQVQVCGGLRSSVWAFDENCRTSEHKLLGESGMCCIVMQSCTDIQSRKTEFLRICFPLPSPPKQGFSDAPLIFHSLKNYICRKDEYYIFTFCTSYSCFGGKKSPDGKKFISFF